MRSWNGKVSIYEYGVTSAQDPQFQDKFEKPYTRLRFPFFLALGNHDQSGTIPGSGVHPERGDFEVAYTQQSSKWLMPQRYYHFAFPVKNSADYQSPMEQPVIEFFVIDTNPLAPQNKPQYDWYRPHKQYDLEQRKWLQKTIAASRAHWKVIVGHHPYRNNGKHSNAGEFAGLGLSLGKELKKMMEEEVCNKVDFVISGHDHSLQWLQPYPQCGTKTQFLISGAGAKSNGPKAKDPAKRSNVAVWETYNRLGFFWIEATDRRMKIIAFVLNSQGDPMQAFEKEVSR